MNVFVSRKLFNFFVKIVYGVIVAAVFVFGRSFTAYRKNRLQIYLCLGNSFSDRVDYLCVFLYENACVRPAALIVTEHNIHSVKMLAVKLIDNGNAAAGSGFRKNGVNIQADGSIDVFHKPVAFQC